jgi:hypothetical protein
VTISGPASICGSTTGLAGWYYDVDSEAQVGGQAPWSSGACVYRLRSAPPYQFPVACSGTTDPTLWSLLATRWWRS